MNAGRKNRKWVQLMLCMSVAGCGGVVVEDRTPPLQVRDAAGFYPLTVRVEKARPGNTISSVTAFTQFGMVTLAPMGGGIWEGTLPLNPCTNGYGVRFEAKWGFLLAGNTEREPAQGMHQKWFDAPAPAACPTQIGRLFTVNSTLDAPDANPGDGLCQTASGGTCTLRAALNEANASTGQDRIELGNATYVVTRGSGDDTAQDGDLDVLDDVAIVGNGAIIEGSEDRVFDVSPTGRAVDFELRGVTVRKGRADRGAGIRSKGRLHLFSTVVSDNQADDMGGGVLNDDGFVEIIDSHFVGNTTGFQTGAGLLSSGESAMVVVRASSFTDNHANQHGGAMSLLSGQLEMRDSTISGNRANVHGGGLFINSVVRGQLKNVTIVDNRTDYDNSGGGNGGGILHAAGGEAVRLSHVIIARNGIGNGTANDDDCKGSTLSGNAFNLIGNGDDCNGPGGNDQIGSGPSPLDPELGNLTWFANGTRGHVPQASSPAVDVDAETSNDAHLPRCTHVDQRGGERPLGPLIDGRRRCDIGAVERNP